MRHKRRNTVRERIDGAAQTVKRWRGSVDRAEKEIAEAIARGDEGKARAIEGRRDRSARHLEAASSRLEALKDSLPRDLAREKRGAKVRNGAMQLAARVLAAAPAAKARMDAERVAIAKAERERRKAGLPKHGSDGKVVLSKKTVPDPFEPGRMMEVQTNTRESPVEYLAARGRLDGAQKAAAERYRGIYERAQLGSLQAMDPAKEKVDGGKISETLNDSVMRAAYELAQINRAIGRVSAAILISIVGEGVSIGEIARNYPHLSSNQAGGFVTGRLLEALDALVSEWGMIGEAPERVRASKEERKARAQEGQNLSISGSADEWIIGRHGDAVKNARNVVAG